MLRENEEKVKAAIEKVASSNSEWAEELRREVEHVWKEDGHAYVCADSIELFALFLSRYELRYKPRFILTPSGMLQVMWRGPVGSSFTIVFETRGNFFAEVRGATLLQHEEVEKFMSRLTSTSLDVGSVWGSKKKVQTWT